MIENKRFTLKNWNDYAEGDCIYYDDGEEMGSLDVLDTLNSLSKDNEQLKQDKQHSHQAMSRQEVRHKKFKDKVFDLIDAKLKEADEGFEQTSDSWYKGKIDVLKELKKELNDE